MTGDPNTAGFAAVPGPDYRADIDGLRALAVVPVVLFHAGVPGFGGGFIGVDVFFVISGFLITQVLARAGAAPARRVLVDFYVRRCRRILPALLAMLAIVTLVAVFLLLPIDLWRYGRFLALAALMLGNFAAWLGGGYFGTAGPDLVHLWSIGIEEQFYLLYPLLYLAWIRRAGRAGTSTLVLLGALSLALCAWAALTHPIANFYSPATRAWELLLGAAVAHSCRTGFRRSWLNQAAAVLALGVLIACLATFREGMHHPGLITFIPCAASALLLATAARRATVVARILASPPLVFTGLISYSLYLWHAPLLSFARYYDIFAPDAARLTIQLLAIYLVSAVSWRWIERPFRRRQWIRSDRRFLTGVFVASLALSAAGACFWKTDGWPQRFSPEIRRLSNSIPGLGADVARCMSLAPAAIAAGELCAFGSADPARPAIVVWGDSHTMALLPAYREIARTADVRLFFAARAGCRPLLLTPPRESSADAVAAIRQSSCITFNAAMLAAIGRLDPDAVVLNAYWNLPDFLASAPVAGRAISRETFARGLDTTLTRIARAGRRVCAVLDAPDRNYVVPYALAMARRRGMSTEFLRMSGDAGFAQQAEVDSVFHEFARRGRLELVDAKVTLCAGGECRFVSDDGWPLYNDADHLSATAAKLLIGPLTRCIGAEAR